MQGHSDPDPLVPADVGASLAKDVLQDPLARVETSLVACREVVAELRRWAGTELGIAEIAPPAPGGC